MFDRLCEFWIVILNFKIHLKGHKLVLQYNLQFYVFNQVKCKESYEEKKNLYISRERDSQVISTGIACNKLGDMGKWENDQ